MKNLFFFLLLATTFSFVGCSDDDDDVQADFMTATIDGNGFEASTLIAVSDTTSGVELILVNGTQVSNSMAIGINHLTNTGTGSFSVAADDFAITFADDIVNGINAFLTEGTLNITRNDTDENILEGTFNFTATNENDPLDIFNVTDGEFRVTYQ